MRRPRTAIVRPVSQWRERLALAVLLCPAATTAVAQMGPVDAEGYVEYRYTQYGGEDVDMRSAHGLLARTNLSTFFWRPWILNASANLTVAQRRADARIGSEQSGEVFGGLRLNFLARSKFPLTLYYEDFDGSIESDANNRAGRTKRYGFLQQYSSPRLGAYSLEWRGGSTDTLYEDGFRLPESNTNESWRFLGRKGFGRNLFTLSSRSLVVDSEIPERHTESLRHTLRHSFRIGSGFDVRNTVFYSNEELDSAMLQTGRTYKQLSSVTTWRPKTARRLLITGRGLVQDSESRGIMDAAGVRTFSLSGTANYQYSDRLTFTAGLGVISGETDGNGSTNSNIQRIGVNYNSDIFPALEGAYRYFGQVSAGNRSNPGDLDESSVQDAGISLGHSFNRTFVTGGGARWDLRLSQQGSTVHDTVGRERNALQHSISLTNGTRSDNITRYLRLSVLDQRNFADERRDYQLANVQYTVQGQVSRNRSWNANASIQYGRRVQDKPVAQAMESASLSYSVTMSYRHADLFDMNNLTFTSDLRWLSEDFRTEDPFDPDYMLETERLNSSWRNRLEYRIGMLQMRGDVDLREVDSMWSLSVLLTVRRYFGMT